MGEINKSTTLSVTATKTLKVKWILADTAPTAPTGYARLTDLDIPLGDLGTLWAFTEP